jgi:hypothetical protein
MADKVQFGAGLTAPTGKIRNPVLVVVFSLITLGIYYVYWWYQINREMVDLGRYYNADRLGDNAFLSLLAVFPGSIIVVPAYVSLYNTVKRIQRAQEVTAGTVTLNGMIILWLIIASFFIFVTALIVPGYIQGELNKAWIAMRTGQEAQAAQVDAPAAEAVPETTAAPASPPPPGS